MKTAKILSDIDPDFAGALTILLVPGTPLHKDWEEGRFTLISPFQTLAELKLIIENSNFTHCFFTANHASNYLPIKVWLPEQKADNPKHSLVECDYNTLSTAQSISWLKLIW